MPPPSLSSLPAELSVITISDPKTFHRFKPEDTQQALVKNAHHIRHLETCYIGVIKWIVKRSNFHAQESSTTVLANETSLLSTVCRNLTRFRLGGFGYSSLKIQDPILPQPTWTSGSDQFVGFGQGSNPLTPANHTDPQVNVGFGQATFGTVPPVTNFGLFGGRSARAPLRTHMNEEEEDLVIHLIQSNPHLQTLCMGPVFNKMQAFLSSLSESYLPNLEDLAIHPSFHPTWMPMDVSSTPAHVVKRLFEDFAETIREIDIGFLVDKTLHLDADLAGSCRSHLRLERLSIRMDLTGVEEYVLLGFLKSCSTNVQSIRTSESVHLTNERLYQEVDRFDLKELDLGSLGNAPDHILARIVSRSGRWRLIDLRHSYYADLTAEAIVNHCQELEKLYIGDGSPMISSPVFHRILCKATKLLELHASNDCDGGRPQKSQLQALDVISSPWVCRSLKTFKANIVGIPRPDVEFQHDGEPVQGALHTGTMIESHDIQRRVLGQLSALTELEELGLGAFAIEGRNVNAWADDEEVGGRRYLDRHFQLTCLELSLASGLELLAGLKRLRVLDVSRMAHRLGVNELEWMQTNWPRLEKVNGLFNDFYPSLVPGVYDWLFEHKPVWGAEYLHESFLYNEARTRGGYYIGA
ncbi:hypothetical protein BGZ92_008545 [Podila epicladia]|nr:hypothetical protein BGZ92_008545 [Podila epicladia]